MRRVGIDHCRLCVLCQLQLSNAKVLEGWRTYEYMSAGERSRTVHRHNSRFFLFCRSFLAVSSSSCESSKSEIQKYFRHVRLFGSIIVSIVSRTFWIVSVSLVGDPRPKKLWCWSNDIPNYFRFKSREDRVLCLLSPIVFVLERRQAISCRDD